MEPSTELETLYRQCCDAMSDGDGAFFERTFSRQEGVVAIGTDPEEWWNGHATISRVFRSQLQETGGIRVVADAPLAYSNGPIGWVAGRPTLELPDGTETAVRLSVVFQKEQEGWRIVQWHFSMGVANEAVIGEPLTTR